MTERDDDAALFELLDPPPGGAALLRARIAAHERSAQRMRRLAVGAGVAAAALLVASLLLISPGRRPLPLGAGDDLLAIRLGLAAAPDEPVTIPSAHRRDHAAARVPTSDNRVVYYRIGSR